MEEQIHPKQGKEFRLDIENVCVRLLIVPQSTAPRKPLLYPSALHKHVSAELFVCGSGSIILKTEDRNIILQNGDAVLIPPDIPHRRLDTDNVTKEETESYALSFLFVKKHCNNSSDLFKKLQPLITGGKPFIYRAKPQIFNAVKNIITESENAVSILPPLFLVELLLKMLDFEPDPGNQSDPSTKTRSSSRDIQRMMMLDQMIESQYMRDLNKERIARQLCLSSRQLDRISLERYGKTLHQVIINKRIQASKQLLLTTEMTIEQISVHVGFNSSVSYYREFKRAFSMTPTNYRKKFESGLYTDSSDTLKNI